MGNVCIGKTNVVEPIPVYIIKPNPDFIRYKAAGCAFTNEFVILGGYQKHKKAISGIGGKKDPADLDYIDTALRETLEELFAWTISPDFVHYVRIRMPPGKAIFDGSAYVMIYYTFAQLEHLLRVVASYPKLQPTVFYEKFPTNVGDLFVQRLNPTIHVEVRHLCLLPMINHISIAMEFRKDIKVLRNKV